MFGKIVGLYPELGVGYVRDEATGILFGISRKFIGEEEWNRLRIDETITFVDTGRNTVQKIIAHG